MSDLISREDVYHILEKKMIDRPLDSDRWVIRDIDKAIRSLPSAEPKWIPVSEMLPIPPTFCLVTTDGSHGDVVDIALYMSDGWHKASEVLAWMPLPEPYKGGDSE